MKTNSDVHCVSLSHLRKLLRIAVKFNTQLWLKSFEDTWPSKCVGADHPTTSIPSPYAKFQVRNTKKLMHTSIKPEVELTTAHQHIIRPRFKGF
jgi:hypothetical protein